MAPIRKLAPKKTVLPTGDRGRDIFNRVKNTHPGKIVQPSYLRSEVVLRNGRPSYEFSFIKDGNSDAVTERKLDRNDQFVVTQLGLFWAHRIDGSEGSELLRTNEIYLADGTNVNSSHYGEVRGALSVLYNGSIAITVGQTKFLEALDTYQFRSEAAGNLKDAGFIELTPQVVLQGAQKNTIALTLPASSGIDVEGGSVTVWDVTENAMVSKPCKHIAVLFARGYLITNK